MIGISLISGMALFFTATTIAVIAYPIFKLLPSRLEKRLYRQIAFHRDASAALELAIRRSDNATPQRQRLMIQLDHQRRCLVALAPAADVAPTATRARDAA